METETEKIYYCDRSNDNVLAASILANSRRDEGTYHVSTRNYKQFCEEV